MAKSERRTARLGLLVALAALSGLVQARPGDVDPDFGTGGRVDTNLWVTPLPDGKILLSGTDGTGPVLTRLDATGRPDATFGSQGTLHPVFPSNVYWLGRPSLTPEGRLLVPVGIAKAPQPVNGVVRLRSDGSFDTSFGADASGVARIEDSTHTGGSVYDGRAYFNAFLTQSDGGILILESAAHCIGDGAGSCEGSYGQVLNVRRLLADGRVDTAYGTSGRVALSDMAMTDAGPPLFALRPDGSLFLMDGAGDVRILGTNGQLLAAALVGQAGRIGGAVLLADGGLLLAVENGGVQLQRLTPALQADAAFGGGTGTVSLDLVSSLTTLNRKDVKQSVWRLKATSGGAFYLLFSVNSVNVDEFDCTGIARLSQDGRLDAGFGSGGLSCVTTDGVDLDVDASGNGLLQASAGLFRILGANRPSPGIVSLRSRYLEVNESVGTVTLHVVRLAGSNGAVSVQYRTTALGESGRDGQTTAIPGSDFVPLSGTLEWSDADQAEKSITLSILQDSLHEDVEAFYVLLESPTGGVVVDPLQKTLVIKDDDPAPAAPTPPPVSAPPLPATPTIAASSGGGALTWPWLLALAGLRLARRR